MDNQKPLPMPRWWKTVLRRQREGFPPIWNLAAEMDISPARRCPDVSWATRCCDVHDDLAMQRRDAAFREAFRRCGGILPRFPGEHHAGRGREWMCWWPGLTHAEVARKKAFDARFARTKVN